MCAGHLRGVFGGWSAGAIKGKGHARDNLRKAAEAVLQHLHKVVYYGDMQAGRRVRA